MSEVAALTLANICLDVQINICMFLHPSDIFALRQTCRALQPSTRQRALWVAALHRVCIDNTLFLPSFPISEMSDSEIEKAAMGPHRWIELCVAFEKQHLNDHDAILYPRTTRIINSSFPTEVQYYSTDFLIVPGGRYMVGSSRDTISVLDLGYTSCADCKLIASVRVEGGYKDFTVQATADGMGLIILTSNNENCSVYEIYPQSETPHLTQIAHLHFDSTLEFHQLYLLSGKVIWYFIYDHHRIDFRVWKYRLPLNHSISFSVKVNVDNFKNSIQVIVTETAVIVLCEEAILIWAIPPLSPQLDSSFFEPHPTYMPPALFTIPFPDGIVREHITWDTISSWYFGSPDSLYFDMTSRDSKHRSRFQILLEPNLSTASLNVINTHEPIPHDFYDVYCLDYMICDDALVCCWSHTDRRCGVYTGLTSPRFANVISPGGPASRMLLPDIGYEYFFFSCPASGRFVRMDSTNSVAVLDFF